MIRLGVTVALAAGLLLARYLTGEQGRSVGLRLRREQWQALIAAFIVIDLLAFGWGLAPGTDPTVYRAPVATEQFLKSQPPGRLAVVYPYAQKVYEEYVSLRSFGSGDLSAMQGLRESLLPNLNAALGVAGAGNYDPLTIRLYRDLWDRIVANQDGPADEMITGESRSALNLLGARYLISDDDLPLPVIYGGVPQIYRNDAALPTAFIVHRARVVEDEETRLEILLDPDFDPRAEVLLSRLPSSPVLQLPAQAPGWDQAEPSVLRPGPDRVIIQVKMDQPGYLVLTDSYYPGWQATLDGECAEILAADHAFRAVGLEVGEHTVVFEYTPLSFQLGAWISGITALLLTGILAVHWLTTRKTLGGEPGSRQGRVQARE